MRTDTQCADPTTDKGDDGQERPVLLSYSFNIFEKLTLSFLQT
jgi:hypothetical protein